MSNSRIDGPLFPSNQPSNNNAINALTGSYQGNPVQVQSEASKLDNAKEELPAHLSAHKQSESIKDRKKIGLTTTRLDAASEEELLRQLLTEVHAAQGVDADPQDLPKYMEFIRHCRQKRNRDPQSCLEELKQAFEDDPAKQHTALVLANVILQKELGEATPILETLNKAKEQLLDESALAITQSYPVIQTAVQAAGSTFEAGSPEATIAEFYQNAVAGVASTAQSHTALMRMCGSAQAYLKSTDTFLSAIGPYLTNKGPTITSSEVNSMMDAIYSTKALRNTYNQLLGILQSVHANNSPA